MSSEEFYIGWQDEMPPQNKGFIKKIMIGIFVLIPILAFELVNMQKPFNHHQFEFGTLTELTGIYHNDPVPILEVANEDSTAYILLVGFGKFGAEEIISDIESEHGELDGKEVTLAGTLIYGDGVTVMELTNQTKSYLGSKDIEFDFAHEPQAPLEIKLTGEILDPKCYFGVMKPGEGKIHKSCAIRCISGGIPPVMRVLKEDGISYNYYLVKGKGGKAVNKEVLPYVAETISVSGMNSYQNGWRVLEIDTNSLTEVEK